VVKARGTRGRKRVARRPVGSAGCRRGTPTIGSVQDPTFSFASMDSVICWIAASVFGMPFSACRVRTASWASASSLYFCARQPPRATGFPTRGSSITPVEPGPDMAGAGLVLPPACLTAGAPLAGSGDVGDHFIRRNEHTGVEPGTDCWLWQSVLIRDGDAIAHLQENVTAQPVRIGKGCAATIENRGRRRHHPACHAHQAARQVSRAGRMPDQPQPG